MRNFLYRQHHWGEGESIVCRNGTGYKSDVLRQTYNANKGRPTWLLTVFVISGESFILVQICILVVEKGLLAEKQAFQRLPDVRERVTLDTPVTKLGSPKAMEMRCQGPLQMRCYRHSLYKTPCLQPCHYTSLTKFTCFLSSSGCCCCRQKNSLYRKKSQIYMHNE